MILAGIFTLLSLVVLIFRHFFSGADMQGIPVFSTLVLISSVWMIPLIQVIKKDGIRFMHPLTTRAAIGCIFFGSVIAGLLLLTSTLTGGTLMFLSILIFAILFHIESRLFFLFSLAGLILTVLALLFGLQTIAESASVFVYLGLVIGVFSEIGAPFFDRFHARSIQMFEVSSEFIQGYKKELALYAGILCNILPLFFLIMIIGRGLWWDFASTVFLTFALGEWVFFALYLFLRETDFSWKSLIQLPAGFSTGARLRRTYDISFYKKYIPQIIAAAIIGILISGVNWKSIATLSFPTIIVFTICISVISSTVMYFLLSFFHRP